MEGKGNAMKSLLDHPDYKLILVDGMNQAYRYFNAMKELSYNGRPTGMLYGIMRFCVRITSHYPNARIVFLWEGGSSRRKSLYKDYKSKREPLESPVTFFDCIEEVRNVLPWFGIDQMWHIGLEADDMAGHMVQATHENDRILLVTKDEDWMQFMKQGQVDFQRKNTIESYDDLKDSLGYPPEKVGMWKILKGDASDSIQGMRGMRERMVRLLVNRCDNYHQFKDYPLVKHNRDWEKWEKAIKEQWESVIERNAELILFHPEWIEPSQVMITKGEKNIPKLKKSMWNAGIKSLIKKVH